MYETMLTRHTTMIVGPTGGGKSVVINTLAQAQTKYLPNISVCIISFSLSLSDLVSILNSTQ